MKVVEEEFRLWLPSWLRSFQAESLNSYLRTQESLATGFFERRGCVLQLNIYTLVC